MPAPNKPMKPRKSRVRDDNKVYRLFQIKKPRPGKKPETIKMVRLPSGTTMEDRRRWKPEVGLKAVHGRRVIGSSEELYVPRGGKKRGFGTVQKAKNRRKRISKARTGKLRPQKK